MRIYRPCSKLGPQNWFFSRLAHNNKADLYHCDYTAANACLSSFEPRVKGNLQWNIAASLFPTLTFPKVILDSCQERRLKINREKRDYGDDLIRSRHCSIINEEQKSSPENLFEKRKKQKKAFNAFSREAIISENLTRQNTPGKYKKPSRYLGPSALRHHKG